MSLSPEQLRQVHISVNHDLLSIISWRCESALRALQPSTQDHLVRWENGLKTELTATRNVLGELMLAGESVRVPPTIKAIANATIWSEEPHIDIAAIIILKTTTLSENLLGLAQEHAWWTWKQDQGADAPRWWTDPQHASGWGNEGSASPVQSTNYRQTINLISEDLAALQVAEVTEVARVAEVAKVAEVAMVSEVARVAEVMEVVKVAEVAVSIKYQFTYQP
ncbi:hypothetical protein WOLCODRAFT_159681 [Wolfiporia cocos MD-104 SS10]|uniref:Uncharacterized protein n=1 Tax=Wolfiporia cocos (strain MD-104) TaxID=742152 RepID=A0A2H3JEJ3_WOLCO|nr:hypothetical protein WOLCODRAFT_159681 [Wolfiporia cocos MD-104 SS10]